MDIANTKYATIKKKGIFVGGSPVAHYRDQEVHNIKYIMFLFGKLQITYPNLQEIHMLMSKTEAGYLEEGEPSAEFGPWQWIRVKLKDSESTTKWVQIMDRCREWGDKPDYIRDCIDACVFNGGILRKCGLESIDDTAIIEMIRAVRTYGQSEQKVVR